MTTVAEFTVHHTAILGPEGRPLQKLPDELSDLETLTALYRSMVLSRTFDAKAVSLQRTGRLGTYASILGQEAVGVGVGNAMLPQDVLLPSFHKALIIIFPASFSNKDKSEIHFEERGI